jgi:hypothetical protein
MSAWVGRALIAAGTAGMVYGVYLWLGTAAGVILWLVHRLRGRLPLGDGEAGAQGTGEI